MIRLNIFFNNITLYKFCKMVSINYGDVRRSITYYKKRYSNLDINEIIYKVVNKYLYLKKIKIEKDTFILMFNDELNISDTCRRLNINRNSVYKLKKHGFTYKETIILIYFLYDIEKPKKSMSIKRVNDIKQEINSKNYTKEINYLICYYYLGLEVSLDIFNLIQNLYIKAFNRAARECYIKLKKEDEEDFIQDMFISIIEALNSFNIIRDNHDGIIKRIYSIFLSKAFMHVKKIKQSQTTKHLEDNVSNDRVLSDLVSSKYYSKFI